MAELHCDWRHLHDDGYIDQYLWHMVDPNLLENDIDEALGRGSHLDRRIARKVPVARRRTMRMPHATQVSASSSCHYTDRGDVGQGAKSQPLTTSRKGSVVRECAGAVGDGYRAGANL